MSTRTLNKYITYTLDITEQSSENGTVGLIRQPRNGNENRQHTL